MLNKNITNVLLFFTLCILFLGIVSATDVETNNETDTTQTITEKTTDSAQPITKENDNVINNNKQDINKDINENTYKTAVTNTNEQIYTYIKLNNIKEAVYGDYAHISGYYYYDYDIPLTYTPMTININGQKYTTKTDKEGYFSYYHITDKVFKNNVTVSYHGNNNFKAATATKTFNVKITKPIDTYITINNIKEVNNGQTTTISGHYYYGNNVPLTQANMKIIINEKTYTARTDNKGYFTYNYKTTKDGTNKVTVIYSGNTNFKSATATKSFNVKSVGPQYTYINLNNIQEVAYGGYTTISGYYYYGSNIPLTLTTMRLNINGKQVTAKTDKQGYFTYRYKTERVGKNMVTVSYPGNNNFKAATNKKTFHVKITSPIYTYITLNNIKEVSNGQTTTISGHYYYGNNIPLIQTNMRVNINGKTYTAKTDDNGYFTCNYKTSKDGLNTVTVSYPGNTNFQSASNTKTFNVKSTGPQYTYIKLNTINDARYDGYAYISGYYYYGNNIPLTYTPMTININGEKYTSKTDYEGYFSIYYMPEKIGKTTVTVSYHGNNNFKAATATKTFNVITTSPINSYISLHDIKNVDYGKYTTIDGYYFYGNDIPLTQTTMTININGQKYATKTDSDGYFRYDYKTNKAGTNTVTVSYPGNTNFQSASSTKTFKVSDSYYTIEINTNLQSTFKKVGHSNFIAWYQTYTNEYNKGVNLVVLDPDAYLDDPSEFLITDATFYFKNNNNGNIISRTYDFGNGVRTEHDLISGYTPYKVVAKYRETTSYEKNLQRNGYWYNPQKGEWYIPYSDSTTDNDSGYFFDIL